MCVSLSCAGIIARDEAKGMGVEDIWIVQNNVNVSQLRLERYDMVCTVCLCFCLCVCACMSVSVWLCLCFCVCVCVCLCVCMCGVCLCVYIRIHTYIHSNNKFYICNMHSVPDTSGTN